MIWSHLFIYISCKLVGNQKKEYDNGGLIVTK